MRMQRRVRVFLCALVMAAALPAQVFAQQPGPPGQPQVSVSGSNVTVTWTWPQTGGAVSNFFAIVTYNGAPYPGSPFSLGLTSSASAVGMPAGSYTIVIRASNPFGTNDSFSSAFTISGGGTFGPPGMPTLYNPTAVGSTVTLTWAAPTSGGTPTGYDIEAVVQSTGQVLNVAVGNQTSAVFPGIAPGNFLVRIRARNAHGVGPWTPQRLLVVGVNLGSGSLQVTLTWNSLADMDLHVVEPDGRHVYYANKIGTTARLDVDDTNGYGPENIYVTEGQAAAGVYRFYIVHYSGSYNTASTIVVRLFPGTAREVSTLYNRTSSGGNPRLGFLVVDVNPLAGTITEVTGTIATDELPGDLRLKPAVQ